MQPRGKRRATRAWELQLELLGPRPRLPEWRSLPESLRGEVTTLLARLLRAACADAVEDSRREEVGDE